MDVFPAVLAERDERRTRSLGGIFHEHGFDAGAAVTVRLELSPSVQGAIRPSIPASSASVAVRSRMLDRREVLPGCDPRARDQQRHAHRAFEEVHLEPEPALAEHVAVIGEEDDHGFSSLRVVASASSSSPIFSSI